MTGKVAFCGASTYGISKKTKGGASHELFDSDCLLDRQGIYHPDFSPHALYPVPEVPTETPSVSNPVKTGDDAPILLYLGIGAGALVLAGALTVLYLRRRKQKENK